MNYCVGFIFNEDLTKVLLVKKNRGPECVKNRLNGIGGKIEKDESGDEAIIRECMEETGLKINRWNYFCELKCNEGIIYLYYVATGDIFNYKQLEDEKIGIYSLDCNNEYDSIVNDFYKNYLVVANINWLIPMALNHYRKLDRAESFSIKEN